MNRETAARLPWNRCDVCGRFIPIKEFQGVGAIRRLITPDSEFTSETLKTLCKKHAQEPPK